MNSNRSLIQDLAASLTFAADLTLQLADALDGKAPSPSQPKITDYFPVETFSPFYIKRRIREIDEEILEDPSQKHLDERLSQIAFWEEELKLIYKRKRDVLEAEVRDFKANVQINPPPKKARMEEVTPPITDLFELYSEEQLDFP